MSKERELLNEWISVYVTNGDLDKVYRETMKFLAQPEQEPMTGKEISQGFRADKDATNAESYWAGVALAEKHHGVTGENK
jgi:hypothetical protein